MFLKRITLSGFKSFCDRVDFDFGPGVTCVVGPNGCGKSNVVDAFKWVLGEQSAHSLRGRQMMDMIFNGSATRKSSGLAQVDLVFDNQDHALALDRDEVTVTRKLYRSGQSEYLLNQEASRLKDIRSLFLDTGVGVEAYSVIEQGRVDGLLQSSPVERRTIFEEAAGVSRYKAHRKEAERKLERTQQNLLRVADIIEELEKRLRSVKLQAGKARNYQEYDARLRELRSGHAMAEYHRLFQSERSLEAQISECSDRAVAHRADIDRNETSGQQATVRLDALHEEINGVDNRHVQARAELTTQQERIEQGTRRIEELQSALARATERHATDSRRLETAQGESAELQSASAELEFRTAGLHARVDELNDRDRCLARELTQAQAVLEDEKAGIIELLRKSAQTHNEIVRLNTHREGLVGQKGRLSHRDAQIVLEMEGHVAQKAELTARAERVAALLAEQNLALNDKKAESLRLNAVRQRLVDELALGKETRSALQSRREVLQDLERRMEGIGAGTRRVLEAVQQQMGTFGDRESAVTEDRGSPRSPVLGLVADVFETAREHALVIEAALGDGEQHLVVTSEPSFADLLEGLGELPGRVTAFCLDRLPPKVNYPEHPDEAGRWTRAVGLVRYPRDLEGLANQLLGKTIVVDDLAEALWLQHQDAQGYRFVTRNGEVVEADGRVCLGPLSSGAGLISRKSELKGIDLEMHRLDEMLRTLTDQLDRTQAEATHLDAVQQEIRAAIYESSTTRVETNAALQNVSEMVERLTQERPLIARELEFLEEQMSTVLSQTAEGSRSLELLEEQSRLRQEQIQVHQDRIDEVVSERRAAQEALTEAKVALGKLTEKRAALLEGMNTLRRAMGELEASVASARADVERTGGRMADVETSIAASREQVTVLTLAVSELEQSGAQLRQRREALRMELEGVGQAVKTARSELATVETQLHEFQMSLAEVRVRRDGLLARTKDELAIDLAERYAAYEYQEQDWAAVEVEIAELRGKMERLGHVNLDAIKELQEIEERHAFLAGQRADLDDSRRQLEELIQRLNQESMERFQTALELIREHFRGLFRRLFGGGRADIILEDPQNVLECGIEIVAQPPGKDLQSISLMSGGEKSMTAIALLMSIFKSRPAPFAILDEVDAALDEANNERFNRIIQEFVKEVQFIIITHSKWTMNSGDRLYGITMQEPGVSTRVSVELGKAKVA